jgi:hypothetical protein
MKIDRLESLSYGIFWEVAMPDGAPRLCLRLFDLWLFRISRPIVAVYCQLQGADILAYLLLNVSQYRLKLSQVAEGQRPGGM